MDTMPLLQLKLQPLTVIRSWLIIRKSLINIWLLLTQLSMAPRNDTRNLFEILLNSINDNTVTTVNDVDFVLINDGVSWKLQDEGNTLGNAIFGTLTDSPLETSDSEDENISADTDKQTDDNTSTESSSN